MQNLFSWLPYTLDIVRESEVHSHVPEEKSYLFKAIDGATTELEILNWLYATVQIVKPSKILETGSFIGVGTLAMAFACKINSFGKVYSLESKSVYLEDAKKLIQLAELNNFVEFIQEDSIEYLKKCNHKFDIGFFDSENSIRAKECEICLDKNILTKMAIFHDTSKHRCFELTEKDKIEQEKYRKDVFELAKRKNCTGYYENELSRGMITLFLKESE